ncbi:FAD-dependent oxidoreductase [Phosphitispora sp. TUW77]|uniref:oxidoreductase n=1 Tax=Phosphitispora sp. TUW77 TaxID=3152361 RepID=UPI003AB643B8
MAKLGKLMSPGRIGSMELHNRIVLSAMGTELSTEEGVTTEKEIRFYEERAKGGVGLIIVGSVSVSHPYGVCIPKQLAISDDSQIPMLKELVDRVHKHGAKIAPQLQHPGIVSGMDIVKGFPLLVPSYPEQKQSDIGTMNDITAEEGAAFAASLQFKPELKVMTKEDIDWAIEKFAAAAERAQKAGFDAIEIHAGHGYLIDSFLNPSSNKRTDEYGGSPENRARLLIEIIQACKKRTGSDYPLICKINAYTMYGAEGVNIEDAKVTAKMAEAAGADAIFSTAYGGSNMATSCQDTHTPYKELNNIPSARQIKSAVKIPVIAVGRIEPEDGDKLIGEGAIDFVAMGRQLLADPELPNKVKEDRLEDIRPCIVCFKCISQIFLSSTVKCGVNPNCSHEDEFQIKKASKPKRVLVVGGGPAGMEAARVAALRGHKVTICDKEKFLGGTLFFASVMYIANYKLVEYLEAQLKKLKVDIQVGVEVTPEFVKKFKPDVVVVATGVKRFLPDLPGVKQTHVLDGDDMRNMVTGSGDGAAAKTDLKTKLMLKAGSLTGISRDPKKLAMGSKVFMPLGKNVVIVGGGLVGVEMAEFLTERGRNVTILEEGYALGWEMSLLRRWHHLSHNVKNGVKSLCGCKVTSIGEKTVTYTDKEGQEHTIDADNVIIAQGHTHNLELAERLKKDGYEVHTVGDCSGDDLIEGAMTDGLNTGLAI